MGDPSGAGPSPEVPGDGSRGDLRRTARRVLSYARETASIANRLGRSDIRLRLLTWLLVAAIPAAIVWASLELRVVTHLVDMHMLDEDPIHVRQGGRTTASPPRRGMTAFGHSSCLDDCSEQLTTGLSRRIRHKGMRLERGSGVDA